MYLSFLFKEGCRRAHGYCYIFFFFVFALDLTEIYFLSIDYVKNRILGGTFQNIMSIYSFQILETPSHPVTLIM